MKYRRLGTKIAALLMIACLLGSSQSVAALTQDDINSVLNNTVFYDPAAGGGGDTSGCSSTALVGSSNAEQAYNYFTGKGLPAAAAAGILGNLQLESGIVPTREQTVGASWTDMTDSNNLAHGVGLPQWDGTRRPAFIKYAESKGLTLQDLQKGAPKLLAVELDYMWYELNNVYTGAYAQMQKETDYAQAAKDFLLGYEDGSPAVVANPEIALLSKRVAYAQGFYNQYGGGAGGSSSSSGSCTIGPGTDCKTVNGDARILCEAEKYQGIYYSWGGGHSSYSTFRQNCPESSISGAAASSTPDNPGPCGTDCSGLVTVAVDGAFNLDYAMSVSDTTGQMIGTGVEYWKSIPISQAQAGDIVTTNAGGGTPGDGHVEIVVNVSGDTVIAFGSHAPGVKTGQDTEPASYWTSGAWHWTGAGSSGS